jgi:hypothetical protein
MGKGLAMFHFTIEQVPPSTPSSIRWCSGIIHRVKTQKAIPPVGSRDSDPEEGELGQFFKVRRSREEIFPDSCWSRIE